MMRYGRDLEENMMNVDKVKGEVCMFSFAFAKQDAFMPFPIIQAVCFTLTYCEDVVNIYFKAP